MGDTHTKEPIGAAFYYSKSKHEEQELYRFACNIAEITPMAENYSTTYSYSIVTSQRLHQWLKTTLVVFSLLIVVAGSGMAQDVAVGQATATVLATLAVSSTAALAFGNVYQGVTSTIANNNASAGIFAITGAASSGILIFMALPNYVALADGSDRMTISFSSTDASVDTLGAGNPTTMAAGSGFQNINPHNFPAAAVIGAGGTTNIYLGGKVLPTIDQTAGAYTGDIILTVAYTGN